MAALSMWVVLAAGAWAAPPRQPGQPLTPGVDVIPGYNVQARVGEWVEYYIIDGAQVPPGLLKGSSASPGAGVLPPGVAGSVKYAWFKAGPEDKGAQWMEIVTRDGEAVQAIRLLFAGGKDNPDRILRMISQMGNDPPMEMPADLIAAAENMEGGVCEPGEPCAQEPVGKPVIGPVTTLKTPAGVFRVRKHTWPLPGKQSRITWVAENPKSLVVQFQDMENRLYVLAGHGDKCQPFITAKPRPLFIPQLPAPEDPDGQGEPPQ
ncbi:MAG: hypothetical protein GMKNLPBB_00187 [Myxococcota bacterium]|nr:hypothetical protein [Myxococcota bacterium]